MMTPLERGPIPRTPDPTKHGSRSFLSEKTMNIPRQKFIYQKIGKWLNKMDRLAYMMNAAVSIKERYRLNELLKREGKANYTGEYDDLLAAIYYAQEINSGFKNLTESMVLYQEQLAAMRTLMSYDKPARVLNFGVCYAHIDSILAKEFPDVEFAGIDKSEHSKAFNDYVFGSRCDNLTIFSGDIFKHLAASDGVYEGGTFFHSRTLCLFQRDFISDLYSAVRRAGFKYIVGFEQHGISYETWEPYIFDAACRPSVYWRNNMRIHPYGWLMQNAGYTVVTMESFKTDHQSPDYGILKIIGMAVRK